MHGGASGMSGTLHILLDLMSCIRAFQWLMCRRWVPPGCLTGSVLDASLHPGCLTGETQHWHISTSPASKRLPSSAEAGDAARTNEHSLMVCCSTLRHCLSSVALSCRYREFIADETRRKWEWQCRHEDEAAFWTSVVNGIIGERHSTLYLHLTFHQQLMMSSSVWDLCKRLAIHHRSRQHFVPRPGSCDSSACIVHVQPSASH